MAITQIALSFTKQRSINGLCFISLFNYIFNINLEGCYTLFFFPNYLIKCCNLGYNANMKSTTKTPLQVVIEEFGGVRALGRAIHKDPSAISKWAKRHGCIPATEQKKVLERAWDRGIELSAHELIFGRE